MTPPPDRPLPGRQFGPHAGDPPTPPLSVGGVRWWRPERASAAASLTMRPANSTGRLAFFALLIFTALLVLAPQNHFPVLQPLRLPFITGCIALGSYLVDRLLQGAPLSIRIRELGVLAAILAWALVTVPASLWPGGSVDTILDSYSKSLVIFFLIVNLVATPKRLRCMNWVLTLVSLPLAVSALVNYQSGVFLAGTGDRIIGYQAGLTDNPNDLALLLNMILPISGGLLLAEPRLWARAAILAIMAVDAVAVIITFSRAGFFVLATTIVLFAWKIVGRRGGKLAVVLVVVAALASVPLLPGGYLQRIGTSFDTESDTTGSAEARWVLMKGALGYVARHPVVGAGIGMDQLAMNDQLGVGVWRNVHNIYLGYAVDLGLPGLALFLLLLGSALDGARVTARRLKRTGAPRALVSLHAGSQVSLIGFAIGAFFTPGAYGWVLHYSVAMAVAARITCTVWSAPRARSQSRGHAS